MTRSSLWTHLDCVNADKTRVYLERSRSSPINLSLDRDDDMSPCDPFFQTIQHAIGRLKSLSIKGTPGILQDITARLSGPAPLLEELSVHGGCQYARHLNPVLTPALFDGNLSSLRKLRLEYVRTKLPWRNMVNLTSFVLTHTLPDEVSVGRLLDFFESAPQLHKVELYYATQTSGVHDERLVSLECLKRMDITGGKPYLLLDHLLIPVGAEVTMQGDLFGPLIEDHLPTPLGNLRNLPNFTTVELYAGQPYSYIKFRGPNGKVKVIARISRVDRTCSLLESLARFDTSKTERLKIESGNSPTSDPAYQALLPMKDLRTLTLYLCASTYTFVRALDPHTSSSGVLICPKLEDLVIEHRGPLDIKNVIGMAAARASRGAKLKSIRIINRQGLVHPRTDVIELGKHVLRVEF